MKLWLGNFDPQATNGGPHEVGINEAEPSRSMGGEGVAGRSGGAARGGEEL
jgi:hypothetical protein